MNVANVMYDVTQRIWILSPGHADLLMVRSIRVPFIGDNVLIEGMDVDRLDVAPGSYDIIADMGAFTRLGQYREQEIASLEEKGWKKAEFRA